MLFPLVEPKKVASESSIACLEESGKLLPYFFLRCYSDFGITELEIGQESFDEFNGWFHDLWRSVVSEKGAYIFCLHRKPPVSAQIEDDNAKLLA